MLKVIAAILITLTTTGALKADTVTPGIKLDVAKKTLEKFGYEVDASKYGLSMDSGQKNIALEFSRIDDEITLIIGYDRRSKKISSLGLIFIPEGLTSADRVDRELSEIRLEEDGTYTVKFLPKKERPKVGK